jgi:hypothetical protein
MYAVLGSVLTTAGLLAVALLTLLFSNPAAPRWTKKELVPELFVVVVTTALGLGMAYLAMTPHQLMTEGVRLVDVAAVAGSLLVFVVVWRALKLRARLRTYAAAASPTVVLASSNPQPTPPRTPRPRSGRPSGKAA